MMWEGPKFKEHGVWGPHDVKNISYRTLRFVIISHISDDAAVNLVTKLQKLINNSSFSYYYLKNSYSEPDD
jgi:hypothetical protein